MYVSQGFPSCSFLSLNSWPCNFSHRLQFWALKPDMTRTLGPTCIHHHWIKVLVWKMPEVNHYNLGLLWGLKPQQVGGHRCWDLCCPFPLSSHAWESKTTSLALLKMAVLIMAQGDYHSKDLPGYQPQLKKPTSPPFLCLWRIPRTNLVFLCWWCEYFPWVLWNTLKICLYVDLVEREGLTDWTITLYPTLTRDNCFVPRVWSFIQGQYHISTLNFPENFSWMREKRWGKEIL